MQSTTSFSPIQQAVQLHLHHKYAFKFQDVANAFLLKYNFENRFCYTTIAESRQIDQDSFEIVRRMENSMSSRPVYERIIFNRNDRSVKGYTFETDKDLAYTEHYVYKQDGEDTTKTLYDMFLYKNPGIKKLLRFKLHSWGVQTLEGIIKKEDELKEKLRESIRERTEALIEKKDKLVHDIENKFNQKKAELQQFASKKDDKRK